MRALGYYPTQQVRDTPIKTLFLCLGSHFCCAIFGSFSPIFCNYPVMTSWFATHSSHFNRKRRSFWAELNYLHLLLQTCTSGCYFRFLSFLLLFIESDLQLLKFYFVVLAIYLVMKVCWLLICYLKNLLFSAACRVDDVITHILTNHDTSLSFRFVHCMSNAPSHRNIIYSLCLRCHLFRLILCNYLCWIPSFPSFPFISFLFRSILCLLAFSREVWWDTCFQCEFCLVIWRESNSFCCVHFISFIFLFRLFVVFDISSLITHPILLVLHSLS